RPPRLTASTTPALYTLSLHDALPISKHRKPSAADFSRWGMLGPCSVSPMPQRSPPSWRGSHVTISRCARSRNSFESRASTLRNRSEEHTSELQSRGHLVCRPLLEKKK